MTFQLGRKSKPASGDCTRQGENTAPLYLTPVLKGLSLLRETDLLGMTCQEVKKLGTTADLKKRKGGGKGNVDIRGREGGWENAKEGGRYNGVPADFKRHCFLENIARKGSQTQDMSYTTSYVGNT